MNSLVKILFVFGGTVSLITGIIGIFLPVLPTVPFILIAVACYFKGSKRLYFMLMRRRQFRKYINKYRNGEGLSPRFKLLSLLGIWCGSLFSGTFIVHTLILRLLLISCALVTTAILLLQKSPKIKKA